MSRHVKKEGRQVQEQKEVSGQLRALDLRRDFEGLSKLIETAFAEDFQRIGVQFQEELKAIRRLVPWVLLLGRFSKFFRELLGGYVWEASGPTPHIVGSAIVQPQGLERRKWYITAVATHPDYRGLGIARRVMEAAVQHVRERGGELALLTVRADNAPAYQLYLNLGFVHFDSTAHLRLDGVPNVEFKQIKGYTLRPMGPGEWRARYKLAKQATPPEVQAFNPISEREYRVAMWMRLLGPFFNFLQRVEDHRWAAEAAGRVVGVLTLQAVHYPSMHQLRLTVHPEHEAAAEALLTKGLSLLKDYPGRGVLTMVRSSRLGLLELFKHYGFAEVSTLHEMGLRLK